MIRLPCKVENLMLDTLSLKHSTMEINFYSRLSLPFKQYILCVACGLDVDPTKKSYCKKEVSVDWPIWHIHVTVHNLTLLSSGHAYIEVIPLLPPTSKVTLKTSREVFLKSADQFHIRHIQAIPLNLFDEDVHFEHAAVRVDLPDPEDQNAFVCSKVRGHQKLSKAQKNFLLETEPLRLLSFVHTEWAAACKAKAVHLGKHARPIAEANGQDPGTLPYYPTHFSSDDSDSCPSDDGGGDLCFSTPGDDDCDELPVSGGKFDLAELNKLRRAHKSLKPVALCKDSPLPSISISGEIANNSKQRQQSEGKTLLVTGTQLNELLENPILSQGNNQLTEAAMQFQHALLMAMRQHQPLDHFFSIHKETSSVATNTTGLAKEIRKIVKDQLKMKKELHPLQLQVIIEAVSEPNVDTVVIAPCCYVKSVCFAATALHRGGITIVIVPLKVIVDNQWETFVANAKPGTFDVLRLLSISTAHRKREKNSSQVLKDLVRELTRNGTGRASLKSRCTLIFSTPELVKANLEDIAVLHDGGGVLSSIIFDEFDVQSEANEDYRGVYISLLPSLREKCSNASFMFLSATASNQDLLTIVPKVLNHQPKIKLFVSHRPLQDSLSFRVERKEDLNQVS